MFLCFEIEICAGVYSLNQSFCLQQGYAQQDYSYAQPAAAPESTYSQAAPSAAGYAQQQYGSSYGQAAAAAAAATTTAAPGLIYF